MKQENIKFHLNHLRVIWLLSLSVLTLFTNPVSANESKSLEAWKSPAYIAKAFKEIALKNEYAKTQQRVLKWQSSIVYQFKYHHLKQNKLVEELFNEQLKHLSEITQHPIQQSLHSQLTKPANLVIHLTQDSHYETVITQQTGSKIRNIHRDSHCMGHFKNKQSGEIYTAHIVLPVDHVFSRGKLVSCIVEETTQLMGLPNDSDWVHPTIANDKSKIEFLTGLDYIMLKILYSKEIPEGMDKGTLNQNLKSVISQLKQQGEIDDASSRVNQSGLYPLVN